VRGADAFKPGSNPHRHASRSGGREVRDPKEVQGNSRAQAARQSCARADRDEGELPLAREPESIALIGAPERCVHVGDWESDIYELYCTAHDLGTNFLVPVQTNRLAERAADAAVNRPEHRVFAQPTAAPCAGRHRIAVGKDETTWLQVTFSTINTLPSVGKQKRYSPQVLT